MTLADRVVVMNNGRIEQVGAPNELYHNPKTQFVAGFIGSPAMNFLPCRLEETSSGLLMRLSDTLAWQAPQERVARYRAHAKSELLIGLRPEHLTDAHANAEPGVVAFDAQLEVTEPMGMETLVYFPIGNNQVCGRVSPKAGARDGAPLRMSVDLNHMHLIDRATGSIL
jgi:multiple sugar transport system ATP-binding protein